MRAILVLLILLVALIPPLYLTPPIYAGPGTYRYYDTFIAAFEDLAKAYPSLITYQTVGKTVENRSIILFRIGNPDGGKIFFDGGMHGEESLGGEVLYAYAKWLVSSNSPLANRILTRTCTLLVPALDADEYNIVRTNANHVDLNRNFATDYQNGGSSDPNSWYYRGPAPLSEPESQTIIKELQTFKPKFYLNLHRGASLLYESNYGNTTYYSMLANKMAQLSRDLNVTPYPRTSLWGAGMALSDAARAGITSYLFEIMDWTTNLTIPQIETTLLPRFLTVAAVLSQECESVSARTLFEDGFESGGFSAWAGTYVTSGETATVVKTLPYQGNHSAKFSSNGTGGYEVAYSYESVPTSSKLYASGYFYVSQSGITNNDDRFYFITFSAGGNNVAYAGWQRTEGIDRWNLLIRDATGWTIDYSNLSPSLNKWYHLELYWAEGTTDGHGELYVNSALVCSIQNKNTTALGNIDRVRFGLAEIYSSNVTTVYADFCQISRAPSWDPNQDGKVDMVDVTMLARAYGSTPSSPNWNPLADLNLDGRVTMADLAPVARHFGEQYA
jgi:hypothetical protein